MTGNVPPTVDDVNEREIAISFAKKFLENRESAGPLGEPMAIMCRQLLRAHERYAEEFMREIEAVCRKHGFAIEHEDCQGAFIVVRADDNYSYSWLRGAHIQL